MGHRNTSHESLLCKVEGVVVVGRTALSPAEVDEVWRRWRPGEAVKVLARAMRRHPSTVRDLLKRCGGCGRRRVAAASSG
jgi:hypothetical protein